MIRRLARGRDGTAAVELSAGLGLLVLPVVVLVASLPAWAAAQTAGRAAAREAARAVATAPDPTLASDLAQEAAAVVAANHGHTLVGEVRLRYAERPAPRPSWLHPAAADPTQTEVTATVTVRLPALSLPGLGAVGAVDWSVSHSEPLDRYRSTP